MKSGEGKGMRVGEGGIGLVRGDFSFIYKRPFLFKKKKTARKYIEILVNSGLWYMDILSYFLYFSVFLNFLKINKNGGEDGNTVPIEIMF